MAPPTRGSRTARTAEQIAPRPLTPNQVVAINLEAVRKRKHWTQLWTVKQLARFGLKWSRANYAMSINTTAKGARVRQFDANELLAFAQTFDVAIWTLFIPPLGATVALPGGGPTLDLNAMRHFAYAITERPAPKTAREAELQKEVEKEVQRYVLDYLAQRMGIDPGSLKPAAVISQEQIPEMADELAAGIESIESTIKRQKQSSRRSRS